MLGHLAQDSPGVIVGQADDGQPEVVLGKAGSGERGNKGQGDEQKGETTHIDSPNLRANCIPV
jgi:hypothetical protein